MQHNLIQPFFCQAGPGFHRLSGLQDALAGGMRDAGFLRCRIGHHAKVIRRIFAFAKAPIDG